MKKILFIISLLLIAVGLNAQFSATAKAMPATNTVYTITPAAGDTIHGSDAASTAHIYVIKVNTSKPYYFSSIIKLDTIKTHHRVLANHVWVQVLGSLTNPSGNDGWIAIGNPVKFGASVDSTFTINDVATGVMYPYLKFRFSGITANKCSKVASFAIKIQEK